MSTKHTQGPWKFFPALTASENHKGFRVVGGRAAWLLADVVPLDAAGKEGEANARLIAAAPELLEALRNAVALADRNRANAEAEGATVARTAEMQAVYDACVAAIAKAEGK